MQESYKCGHISSKKKDKVLKIINIYFLITLLCIFSTVAENAFSQTTSVSIELKNVTLKEAFQRIENSSDFLFLIMDNAAIELSKKVTVSLHDKTIDEILDVLLENTQLVYSIVNRQVTVSKTSVTEEENRKESITAAVETVQQVNQKLTGTVTDKDGDPLIGATVVLKSNTARGTVTDNDGRFSIDVPNVNGVLIVSYVGFIPKEVAFRANSSDVPLRIILEEEELEITEVVVTGIFNKAKESYTGAATIITLDEIQSVGNRSLLSSIQNIDPSFNILQDITIGSDPNALPSVTIRGSSSLTANVRDLQEDNKNLRDANQPLFIMDGFEISIARFMDLDENQVESITLLKDNNATSLYGSRGANGVVVITSKRPKEGRLQVTYRGGLSIEAPDLTSYSLMDAQEKLRYEKAAGLYYSENANHEQELLDLYNQRKIDAERGVDTYWIKYPVRVGVGNKHSLRLEGGDQAIRYAGGISYNNIAGAMKGSERNTFNGNMFLQYRYRNLIFQNDLQISQNKSGNSPYGTFQDFAKINAYWTPYDEDHNLKRVLEDFHYSSLRRTNFVYNPLYNALLPQRNESKYTQITNNFSFEWRFNKDIFARGRFSATLQNNRSDQYISAKDTSFDGYTGDNYDRKGRYTYGTGESSSYDGDITLNYSKLFADKHQVFVGLGYNVGETRSENYTIVAEGIANINMDFLGMANQYFKDGAPSGSEGISRRVGVSATTNYTYDRRYFVDFTARGEGSSRFGANRRFAPFWSTGAGWNIHHESFLKDNPTLNVARVRLSYGTSGSQNFNPYQALTTFRDYGGNNYRGWNGVYLLGLGNPDLGWQTTYQTNAGTELELFRHRVRLHFDIYNKVTNNLLADINLPSSSGFSTYKANVGKVLNRGFETSLNLVLIRNREHDLTWSAGGSMIHNHNEIMEISNSLEMLNEQLREQSNINPTFMFEEGQSISTIYAVQSKGIDPSSGQEIFIKRDGTETFIWDSNDKVASGLGVPKYQGNFNTTLRYKGITLNAIFSYRYGGQMYNYTLVSKVENIYPYDNADKRALHDRWKEPGDIVFFKNVRDFSTTNASSRFVMDENTLECRSLSLGYELPTEWLKKNLFLEYLAVTGFAEDLFHVSSIKQERGLSYPYSRKFSFSVTARF